MTVPEIVREKTLAEIIVERDAMILNLVQENERLKTEKKKEEVKEV
jgi:hypothetical protein